MKTIKRYVSLGLTLIRMGWQSQISYMGFSALLSYVAQIIQFASKFGVVWLMMLSFTDLAGFGLWEVLVIFALELFSYAPSCSRSGGCATSCSAARWISISCGRSTRCTIS